MGKSNFIVGKSGKHLLSQMTKVNINNDKLPWEPVPLIYSDEKALYLCDLLTQNP